MSYGRPSTVQRSRPSMVPSRLTQQSSNAALAEELEKTEQSITLALQEIDRNFATANKIVGDSVLPVLEKYSNQSKELWKGAGFWKQFLEAAANLSLSGYEEPVNEHRRQEQHQQQQQREEEYEYDEEQENGGTYSLIGTTVDESQFKQEDAEKPPRKSNIMQSTPMQTRRRTTTSRSRSRSRSKSPSKIPRPTKSPRPLTPRTELFSFDENSQLEQSDKNKLIDLDMSTILAETPTKTRPDFNNLNSVLSKTPGILRHQVLDKNLKIQVTPLKPIQRKSSLLDLEDSPEIETPTLQNASLFNSSPSKNTSSHHNDNSFMTPKKKTQQQQQKEQIPVKLRTPIVKTPNGKYFDDSSLLEDSSDIDMGGMSPPVTMQFGYIKDGKNVQALLKTPARVAAKSMVDSILKSVGAGDHSESLNSFEFKNQFDSSDDEFENDFNSSMDLS